MEHVAIHASQLVPPAFAVLREGTKALHPELRLDFTEAVGSHAVGAEPGNRIAHGRPLPLAAHFHDFRQPLFSENLLDVHFNVCADFQHGVSKVGVVGERREGRVRRRAGVRRPGLAHDDRHARPEALTVQDGRRDELKFKHVPCPGAATERHAFKVVAVLIDAHPHHLTGVQSE